MMRYSAFCLTFFLIQCASMCGAHAAESLGATTEDQSYQMSMKNARARLIRFIEMETYQLTGFDEIATIPITYPIDICLMEINDVLYASCLHVETLASRNQTAFKLFKQTVEPSSDPLNNYELIFSLRADGATGMDCGAIGVTGFVVVVKTIDYNADDPNDIRQASPVIQVKDGQATIVQYFAMPQQNTAHLQRGGSGMYLLQTFHSNNSDAHQCPIYKWTETTFNEIDALPCTNAMRAEVFIIDHEVFLAFANHMDEFNNAETYSVIYKFDLQQRKFNLLQKMKTYGATDIKYFQLNSTHKIEHFLIVANTFASTAQVAANAIIYEFDGEKFIPFQILNFDAPIKQFLPVSSKNGGFVLLIALEHKVSKSFQYDGRTFVGTKVKFTGGSFGRGVSSMRSFQLDHEEIIVVANSEMLRDATNLFRPKYTMQIGRDMGNAISKFDGWYDKVKQKVRGNRLDDLFDQIGSLRVPIDINVGMLSLQRGEIKTVQTDELKGTGFAVNKKVMSASMQLADDIFAQNVLSTMELLRNTQNASDQSFSASASVSSMNVIDELIIADTVNVLHTLNGHRIEDLVFIENDLNLDALSVDQLVVYDASNLAEIQAKLAALTSSRRRRSVGSDVSSPLRVNQLFVSGRLNGLDFSDLQENALRTNSVEQQLNANTRIDVATANVVRVRSNTISKQNLADLVSIRVNSTLIEQDIQFTQPIIVNELNIMNRFNHMQVINNRLDALFRRAKGVQVITGNKVFESVALLEPIFQQGKIDIRSPIMAQIKPMVNVDQDIVLTGDYSISGNVTIENLLAASNLFGRSGRYSAKQLQTDALRIDESVVNVAVEFVQPIKVENVLRVTRINHVPISTFIKRNVDDIQTITGTKVFSGDLYVENGLCDAYIINGIDLMVLNRTVLKKNAENQIVSGTIHFGRILADNIRYRSLRLGNLPIQQFLTRHTNQIITGNIKIHGNVFVANNSGVSVRHLATNNNVFGVALDSLLDDCGQHVAKEPIHLSANKWINQMYVGHLVVETDFWRTGKPDGAQRSTAAIEARYKLLRSGLAITDENIILSNAFTIEQMDVTETINGMSCTNFGQEWLLTEKDQTFSVAQTFARVSIEDDVTLGVNSYINSYHLPTLYYQTIWRNTMQPVDLKNIAFETVIVEGAVQLNGLFSGLRLPDDLILRNSSGAQSVNEVFVCEGSVRIYGEMVMADTLNRHNHSRMCDLISESGYSPHGLVVDGDSTFKSVPTIDYLNGQLFSDLLAVTWFVDDEFVSFGVDDIRFEQVTLQQSVTTAGKVNGQDLIDLNARYLSLTKAQQIRTLTHFQNSVHFKKAVTVTSGNVSLYGEIVSNESIHGLNLTHFRDNVLKKSSGIQTISGDWKFANVKMNGSLHSTLINNLNFNNDIVRFSRHEMNIICATKTFSGLRIRNLVCHNGCSVNEVDLGEWIARAVLVNNNYTIQGTTYLRNPVISRVDALATVNNMTFRADQILLKTPRQSIYRDLHIGNSENPLQKLTFESIYLNYLNGQNFTAFHLSLIQRATQRPIVANVATNMQFAEPLTIEDLECFVQVNGVDFSSMDAINSNRLSEYYRAMVPGLRTVAETFVGEIRTKMFDRMALRQTLLVNEMQKLYKLNSMQGPNGDALYAVLSQDADTKRVQFYGWSVDAKRLTQTEEISLHLPNEPVVDLTVVALDAMELIVVQTRSNHDFTQSFYRSNGSAFDKVYHIEASNRTTIAPATCTIQARGCILIHTYQNATSFDILHVNASHEVHADLQMTKLGTQDVGEMKQLIAGNGRVLVILGIDHVLTILDYDFQPKKIERTIRDASEVAARTFEQMVYIAVSTITESSAHAIQIYRYSTDQLEPVQTLETRGPIVQCGFAHFANNEFILMVQMADASIGLYKYHGIDGFQTVHNIKVNGSGDTNSSRPSFSLVEDRRGYLELLAINTGLEVGIVECVFH